MDQPKLTLPSFEYYEPLKRLQAYVKEHLRDRISLTLAAKEAHIAVDYFPRYFREKTGISFHDWICSLRIADAKELFEKQDVSVLDAALAVGFGSVRTFQRVFKTHTGMSPFQYKKRVRPRGSDSDSA